MIQDFCLKDFFTSRGLDYLYVREVWLNVGPVFSLNYNPATAAICFACGRRAKEEESQPTMRVTIKLLLSPLFSSFELGIFELARLHTVLCVYRPPKYNMNFLNDFSNYLAEIIPKYVCVLIVGDFNVHVCCPDKPITKY